MNKIPIIIKISGPLVEAVGLTNTSMYDVVLVGKQKIKGEVIEMRTSNDGVPLFKIQVYEDTGGIAVGEPVESTGEPLSVMLGPGILRSFYDGIQRPLQSIAEETGIFIYRGVETAGIDLEKKWSLKAVAKKGDQVEGGDILGEVKETELITHKVMVPPGVAGEIKEIKAGDFKVEDIFAKVVDGQGKVHEISMLQKWPIRTPRPVKQKMPASEPLVTGQRVIDTFFPMVKGGSGNVPGPFGSGKTVVQHQISKFSNAQVIVYVGCGERGNEMTDVLTEFPELKDPYTGKPLMEKTVLIANTSNMPIAAREASIYTGITLAEYYRDMGYDVAVLADSTSRWAEAMREISGRLEEMPGEEGYPAYISSRVATFYERAGLVETLGSSAKQNAKQKEKQSRKGSISVVGAISPPGGDLSEPVSQASLKFTKVFWALDADLAYARHYPAINWLLSYSLYADEVDAFMKDQVNTEFPELRQRCMQLLQKEEKLIEIVRIVGLESLSNEDRLNLDTAKSIREDFLQQNAFVDVDNYTSLEKQFLMLKLILSFHDHAMQIVHQTEELDIQDLLNSDIKEYIAKAKFVEEEKQSEIERKISKMPDILAKLVDLSDDVKKPDLVESVNYIEPIKRPEEEDE